MLVGQTLKNERGRHFLWLLFITEIIVLQSELRNYITL